MRDTNIYMYARVNTADMCRVNVALKRRFSVHTVCLRDNNTHLPILGAYLEGKPARRLNSAT